jgi:hypothetical protein
MALLHLETACLDCVRYDPTDPLAEALALISSAPYLAMIFQAAVSGLIGRRARLLCMPTMLGRSA